MVHGDLIRKATDLYGKDVVEDVITAVQFRDGDYMAVREICEMTDSVECVECIDILYQIQTASNDEKDHVELKKPLIG